MKFVFLIIGLFICGLKCDQNCQGVILDAGSSGTRIYIYQFPCRVNQTMPYIDFKSETLTEKVKPSLVDVDINNIQHYFKPILQFIYQNVPASRQKSTPIFFSGSATLGGLEQIEQKEILEQIQMTLSQSNLLFLQDNWASIITGQEEGYYMWLSINYLLGLLNQPNKAAAIIDLGGTSAQIAYKPYKMDYRDHSQDVIVFIPQVLFINIYSNSFYGYGNDLARYTLLDQIISTSKSNNIDFPCYNQGYQEIYNNYTVFGTGNPANCLTLIKNYFNSDPCPPNVPQCTINGQYRPPLAQNVPIYGVGAIYYAYSFFHLASPFQLISLKNVGSTFCAKTWSQVLSENPDNPYLYTQCFLTLYSYSLMANGLGLDDDSNIYSTEDISGLAPSWTIGNFFYDLGQIGCQFDSSQCQSINNIF